MPILPLLPDQLGADVLVRISPKGQMDPFENMISITIKYVQINRTSTLTVFKSLTDRLIDFNDISTRFWLFDDLMLGNPVHIYIFLCSFF